MTGIWLFFAMMCSTSASSRVGTATRTMSQPEAVNSAICCRVPLMSVVCVVVIDCTLTCAPPPTRTLPTLIWRDFRRGARRSGTVGIPRFTAGMRQVESRADGGAGRTQSGGCHGYPPPPYCQLARPTYSPGFEPEAVFSWDAGRQGTERRADQPQGRV